MSKNLTEKEIMQLVKADKAELMRENQKLRAENERLEAENRVLKELTEDCDRCAELVDFALKDLEKGAD